MPTISVKVKQGSPSGDVAVSGEQSVMIAPPRVKVGDYVRTSKPFAVTLTDGAATMSLAASPAGKAYRAEELWDGGETFWFVVPASPSTQLYADLVRVDESTLDQEPDDPAWTAELNELRDLILSGGGGGGGGPVSSELITDAGDTGKALIQATTPDVARDAIGAQPAGDYATTTDLAGRATTQDLQTLAGVVGDKADAAAVTAALGGKADASALGQKVTSVGGTVQGIFVWPTAGQVPSIAQLDAAGCPTKAIVGVKQAT